MQGFIDNEYYVYCSTREEVVAFREMCEEHGLQFTTRWNTIFDLENENLTSATFVHNWHDAPPEDGVSFWSWDNEGDGERPCVRFTDIKPLVMPPNIDTTDFLSIL